jgi:predicted amidohydrolase
VADRIRIACVQLTSGREKAANIEKAERLVAQAASTGADVVALPEKWNVIGPPDVLHETAETIEDGESVAAMRNWARAHGVTLIGGSITERREGRDKLSNTCLVFDSEGEVASVYRKIHLFDVEVGGLTYRESEAEEHGDEPVLTEIEGWPVGLTICYDLRFPRAVPRARARGRAARDGSGAFHTLHRQGPLAHASARPRRRERLLRRGACPSRRDRDRAARAMGAL